VQELRNPPRRPAQWPAGSANPVPAQRPFNSRRA